MLQLFTEAAVHADFSRLWASVTSCIHNKHNNSGPEQAGQPNNLVSNIYKQQRNTLGHRTIHSESTRFAARLRVILPPSLLVRRLGVVLLLTFLTPPPLALAAPLLLLLFLLLLFCLGVCSYAGYVIFSPFTTANLVGV